MRLDLCEVNAVKHAHHVMRPGHVFPVRAELRGHDRRGLKRSMPLSRALHIGVVVGIVLERLVPYVGAVVQKAQHLGTVVEVGVDQRFRHVLAKQGIREISLGCLPRILGTGGLGIVAVRHPDPAP